MLPRPHAPALASLAILCLLAYANTFNNGFVFDDEKLVVENRFVQGFDLSALLTGGYWAGAELGDNAPPGLGGVYRPLVLVSYALNHLVGGLNPLGYHMVNLGLHLFVSFLVYGLAFQLGASRLGALAGAALFAVHPVHTEAVAAIYGRPELLMSLGVLAGLSCYIAVDKNDRPVQAAPWSGSGLMVASLGSFALGLLSKEQAVMLPVLIFVYDLCNPKWEGLAKFLHAALFRYAPYLLVLGIYMGARIAVLGVTVPEGGWISFINNPLAYVSWQARLFTAIKIAGDYLWLCVWPIRLAMDYSYDSIPVVSSVVHAGVIGSILAWGGLIGVGLWSFVRSRRLILIGTTLTMVTFLPASNMLIPIGTIMGERLFYLPSAGLALLAVGGWDWLESRARVRPDLRGRGLLWAGFAAVILLLAIRTVARNRDWHSNETLFRSAVLAVPRNAKVQHNLGILEKDLEKAVEHLERSREIYPNYVRNNSRVAFQEGLVWLRAERLDEAIKMFELAARRRPKIDGLLFNLGFAYMKQGRWADAEGAYRKAIALDVRDIRIHNNLSFVLWKQEKYAEALAAADLAAGLNPNFSEAHYNRGAALEAMGKLKEAVIAYEQALKLRPSSSVGRRLESVRQRLGADGRRSQY